MWFWRRRLFYVSHCKSMEANDPQGGSIYDPRCVVCRIYKEDHYTKYESSAPCGFREDNVF